MFYLLSKIATQRPKSKKDLLRNDNISTQARDPSDLAFFPLARQSVWARMLKIALLCWLTM